MTTPELITEPPASIDVECGHMDLHAVIQQHQDRGYRPCCLEVRRGSYLVTFARIAPTPARITTQTGG